ncbi:MAG: FAD-linked oxidase C-terminal domain-containing protein, partial [Paraclostridium bifermentans]
YILRDELNKSEWDTKLKETFEKMYEKSRELRGQVSGEHGIGYAKKEYLNESQSESYMDIIKNIKLAFDAKNILNPGKIY